MNRPIRWGRSPCPHCHNAITNNALGRAAHVRWCTGLKPDEFARQQVKAHIARLKERDAARESAP